MRPRRRGAPSSPRSRAVPARSRVTVRRDPSLPRLATALRQSREALGTLQDELDALLKALRNAEADPAAADRLLSAARAATLAFAGLTR